MLHTNALGTTLLSRKLLLSITQHYTAHATFTGGRPRLSELKQTKFHRGALAQEYSPHLEARCQWKKPVKDQRTDWPSLGSELLRMTDRND